MNIFVSDGLSLAVEEFVHKNHVWKGGEIFHADNTRHTRGRSNRVGSPPETNGLLTSDNIPSSIPYIKRREERFFWSEALDERRKASSRWGWGFVPAGNNWRCPRNAANRLINHQGYDKEPFRGRSKGFPKEFFFLCFASQSESLPVGNRRNTSNKDDIALPP